MWRGSSQQTQQAHTGVTALQPFQPQPQSCLRAHSPSDTLHRGCSPASPARIPQPAPLIMGG